MMQAVSWSAAFARMHSLYNYVLTAAAGLSDAVQHTGQKAVKQQKLT